MGPLFGWLIDRYGRIFGIAWRSAANIGSSILYIAIPNFIGLAAARSFDDSGKGAFRPAWASTIASIASKDPQKSGRRLGVLDTSQSVGEAIGPALATILWQSGGVFALFGVRIVIAVVAEILHCASSGNSGTQRRVASLAPPSTTILPASNRRDVGFEFVVGQIYSTAGLGRAVERHEHLHNGYSVAEGLQRLLAFAKRPTMCRSSRV